VHDPFGHPRTCPAGIPQQPANRGGVVRPEESRNALGAAFENVIDHTFEDERRNGLDIAVGDDISLCLDVSPYVIGKFNPPDECRAIFRAWQNEATHAHRRGVHATIDMRQVGANQFGDVDGDGLSQPHMWHQGFQGFAYIRVLAEGHRGPRIILHCE